MIDFNSQSPRHISVLLFGGSIKYKDREYNGLIKTGVNKGQIKYKVVEKDFNITGLGLIPDRELETKNKGVYQTDEEVLKRISKSDNKEAAKICSLMLQIRGLNKQLGTYYNNTEELVQDNDSCVHQQLMQVKTDTGRTSAKSINSQNQPKVPSKVTQHFISRFREICLSCAGTNYVYYNDEVGAGECNQCYKGYLLGKIVITDYKALEPRVEAELSEDKNLRKDVINNVDPHIKNLALAEYKTYEEVVELIDGDAEWSSKRSKIKGFTFSQQYLASVRTTAKNSGMTEFEVTKVLEARVKEYPKLYKWHEENQCKVAAKGFLTTVLGRILAFKKYPMKYHWQKEESYSKNDIANYPSQATGWDVCGISLGNFWRTKALYNRHKYLIINTIHDSVMLDCKQEYLEDCKKDLEIFDNWKELCYNKFKYLWNVEMVTEIKEGNSWYDCN